MFYLSSAQIPLFVKYHTQDTIGIEKRLEEL